MAIYVPGKRDRHNRPARGGKRSVVAMLSLTAMVDMFTVLVVFLLQNYNTTGAAIELDDKIELPKANAVKELKPAHVVILSKQSVSLDKTVVATFAQVQQQQEWRIEPLYTLLQTKFKEAEAKRNSAVGKIREAVDETKPPENRSTPEDDKRVTVQADKTVDFLTVKKIMATLTDAGASEISFAVMKEEEGAK